jgi:cellulose synthase (UDP-forming)
MLTAVLHLPSHGLVVPISLGAAQSAATTFDKLTSIRSSAGVGAARFLNIATDGAVLQDSALLHRLPVGHPVEVHVPEVGWISACVARHTKTGAELRFDRGQSLHERLVRRVFSVRSAHVAT